MDDNDQIAVDVNNSHSLSDSPSILKQGPHRVFERRGGGLFVDLKVAPRQLVKVEADTLMNVAVLEIRPGKAEF